MIKSDAPVWRLAGPMTPNNLDWILGQLDLGNDVPGWSLVEDPPEGFTGVVRAEDDARWVRLIPNGPWIEDA